MEKPIAVAKDGLLTRLLQLEEGGSTALGPALLVSCGVASKKAGSKVIICTDGLANVGLGALDGNSTKKEAQSFYEQVGVFAKKSGIEISIISIQGTECRMENFGKAS